MRVLVDQFCCGCKLQTGAIVIGAVSIVYAALVLLTSFTFELCSTKNCSVLSNHPGPLVLQMVAGAGAAVLVLASIFLLVGAKLERACLLLPWLVFTTVCVLLKFVAGTAFAVWMVMHAAYLLAVASFLVGLNMAVLPGYCIVVVASLYRELK